MSPVRASIGRSIGAPAKPKLTAMERNRERINTLIKQGLQTVTPPVSSEPDQGIKVVTLHIPIPLLSRVDKHSDYLLKTSTGPLRISRMSTIIKLLETGLTTAEADIETAPKTPKKTSTKK